MSTAAPRFATRIVAGRARRSAVVAIICALLTGLSIWVYLGVERSVRELRAQSLPAVLDAKTRLLEALVDGRLADGERLARHPDLAPLTRGLIERALAEPQRLAELCAGRDIGKWREMVRPLAELENLVAVNAIDLTGHIVASTLDGTCGQSAQARISAPRLADVMGGHTQFLRPFARDPLLVAAPPFLRERPLAWIEVPVRDDRDVIIGAVGFAVFVDTEFQSILAQRTGRTDDAYAFDERGIFLSEPRFAVGRPDAPESKAAFTLPVRDAALGESPLTPPVEAALAAAQLRAARSSPRLSGLILSPYRNYAGHEVIGGWRWLPDAQIGVVAEIGVDEAFAPLFYVRSALGATLALFVLTAAFAAWSGLSLIRASKGLAAGRRLGAYKLERKLAEGGMANVHFARHALLKRPTAVKILKRHLATDENLARFEREVRLASELSHPNTVEIYDFGHTPDGLFYYAMEYIEGLTLNELVYRDGPLPVERARRIALQVAHALVEIHGRGMIHRDLKPDNVMITERGALPDFAKLVDFGIGKRIDAMGPEAHPEDRRELTRSIRLIGTPAYMAPERIADATNLDPRSDLYGLGGIVFFLLAGRPPFVADDDASLMRDVLAYDAPRLSAVAGRDLPEAMDRLCAWCLAKAAGDRPASVREVIVLLESFAADDWDDVRAMQWWQQWHATRPTAEEVRTDASAGESRTPSAAPSPVTREPRTRALPATRTDPGRSAV